MKEGGLLSLSSGCHSQVWKMGNVSTLLLIGTRETNGKGAATSTEAINLARHEKKIHSVVEYIVQ